MFDEDLIRVLKSSDDLSLGGLVNMASKAKNNPLFADALVRQARAAKAARMVMARYESSTFCEYVLKAEGDGGKAIAQAPFHEAMHSLVRGNNRVVMWGSPGTGKSLQFSVGYPLWLLGRNPDLHIAIVQATDGLAKKSVRTVGAYVDDPHTPGYDELHQVFPHLIKSRRQGTVWNTHAITVDRQSTARDPSFQSCGLFGNILGARLDVVLVDDVLTFANTRTQDQREKTLQWILTTLLTRLFGSKVNIAILMGNAWHPEDAMHVIASGSMNEALADAASLEEAAKNTGELRSEKPEASEVYKKALSAEKSADGWVSARFPLRDHNGKTTWPEVWTQEKLDRAYASLPPAEAARAFECLTTSDATSRFKREWFDGCKVPRLAGMVDEHRVALMRSERLENDERAFYVGVDLAFADIEKRGDRSAISVIAVDSVGRVELIQIKSGRWMLDDLLSNIVLANEQWNPRFIFVESNGAQVVISRALKGDLSGFGLTFPPDLRRKVVPFTTTGDKHNPKWGIEGIGVEMKAKLWSIPCGDYREVHHEVEAWIQDLLHYSPDPSVHTGDRAMSVYMAWDGCRRRLGERHFGLADIVPMNTAMTALITETIDQKPVRKVDEDAEQYEQRAAKVRNDGIAQRAVEREQVREVQVWDELNDWLAQ